MSFDEIVVVIGTIICLVYSFHVFKMREFISAFLKDKDKNDN